MIVELVGQEELPEKDRNSVVDIMYKILNAAELDDYIVNVSLVDAASMKDLNLRFKKKRKVTDILSFPTPEEERSFEHTKNLLGDMVICVSQAELQAVALGHTLLEEMAVLCAHGLFHLLGYDHENSKEEASIQMQGEMYLLEKVGLSPELSLIGRA